MLLTPFKLLFLLILLYYAVRASHNLARAVMGEGARPPEMPPHGDVWQAPETSPASPHYYRPDVDIEDARFEDVHPDERRWEA